MDDIVTVREKKKCLFRIRSSSFFEVYVRHGAVSLEAVRQYALTQYDASTVEKFLQELTWRHFWQAHYAQLGDQIWEDIEPYKTGWSLENYSDELPEDIVHARTGVAVIDYFSH